MKRLLPIFLGLLCAAAQAAGDGAAERRGLTQQRSEIEARFGRETLVCQQRFAVNSCLDEARARRLAELKPVAARQEVLDAEERRARSIAQRERVAERQRDATVEEGRRITKTLAASAPVSKTAAEPRSPPISPQVRAQTQRAQAAKAESEAQRNRAQSAERQLEFEQRQRDRQQRDQRRATQDKKPGISLPVPSAAAIAAAASAAASAPRR